MATNKKSGFFNGLGYLGEKIGAGFMQSVEGVWDFAAGGLADVFGADEWAKKQMSNDWFGNWYNTAGDWFDAKGGWKTAGDVAGGIGTTLPAIVAAVGGGVATALTGGAAAPLAVKAIAVSIAPLTAGLGAAGTSTKEAYQKTGELTGKEYGYGALSGALEAGIEAVTGGIGTGSARIAKSAFKGATKTAAQEAAEAVAKKSIKDIAWKAAKRAGADFVSEGVEEGLTELISPYLQRVTYDPSAKNATSEEIAYAAVIGGLAGAVLGSTGSMIGAGVNTISDAREGAKAIEAGQEQEILALAKDISEQIGNGEAGYEVLSAVKVVYDRLVASISSGKVTTLQQKADLGKLKKLLSVTPVLPTVELSAMGLVSNPEAAIAKYSQLGITDENGNPITVEKLTEGLDFDENGRASVSSLRKAISQNRVLGTLAIAEATGRLMVDHNTYLSNATTGGYLGGRAQYQNFVENAYPEQKIAMAQLVGAENLDAVDYETFAKRMIEYGNSPEGSAKIRSARDIRNRAENIPENEKAIPPAVSAAMEDGVHRFGGKEGVAIFKNGDTVRIYDYETRNTTRELTVEEASAELRKARRALTETATKSDENTAKPDETTTKAKKTTDDIDTYAKENVKGYEDLMPAERREIRAMIRQAKALGIPDADIKMYARVAARSGIRISFSKDLNAYTKNDGTTGYSDGFYDPKSNTIVVNPEGTRSAGKLLMHELSHALYSYKKYRSVLEKATRRMDEARAKEIKANYEAAGESDSVISEELLVHHAEDVLGSKANLERVIEEEPNIKSKILSFFRVAKIAYQGDERLSMNAGRLYKHFEKAFNDFAARNKRNLAADTTPMAMSESMDDVRYSFSSIGYSFFGREATISEMEKREYKKTDAYRQRVDAFIENMRQTNPDFDAEAAKKEIVRSIDGIVDVAIAAKKAGYDIIDTNDNRVDSKGRKLFSSLEPNSDYFTSHDISTICDKRKNFTAIHDEIVHREERLGVPKGKRFFDDIRNYFVLHKILAEKGLTAPCHECYVESMRKNLAPMSKAFMELMKETDVNNKANESLWNKNGTPKKGNQALREKLLEALSKESEHSITVDMLTDDMLTTSDGLAELRLKAPLIFEAYNSFYGQSKPKMPKEPVPYRFGELTALLTDDKGKIKQGLVDRIKSTGGFRLQSYSDFQIENFVDVLQVIFEAGTLGLNGHAYTKVPAFLKATENTNLKRNISIFTYNDGGQWKIDRYDSFPMPLDEIYKLVDADKTGNTGIINVTQNASNAAWAMANPHIWYGIPYHKSGQTMSVARSRVVKADGREILGYSEIKDHTRQQSEVWSKTVKDGENVYRAGTKVKEPINIYSFWDFENSENLPQKDLIKKNLMAYIDRCVEKGYHPKFREYLLDNSSVINEIVKFSREFGDTNATPDTVAFKYKGYTVPYGYVIFLGDFAMFGGDGKASPIERLSLAKYDFDEAVKFFENSASLRRNELLQQIANDGERDRYITGDRKGWGYDAIKKEVDKLRKDLVSSVVSTAHYKFPNEYASDYLDTSDTTVYTEDMYNRFGWARDVGGLSKAEMDDLESKIISAKSVANFNRSEDGEFIVPVNNDPRANLGVNNVFVFAKGTKRSYVITRTIRFDAYSENIMEEMEADVYRERTFDSESFDNLAAIGFAKEYRRQNSQRFGEYIEKKRAGRKDEIRGQVDTSDQVGDQRGGSSASIGGNGSRPVSHIRRALPDTAEAVGKTRKEYEPSKKEAFFTAKDRAYIEAIDELYGIEKYLHKVGGTDKATVAARVQMARSARSQAQTMIGTAQFNVFSDKPEKMGAGLLEIYKPTRLWSAEKRKRFDDYLLHCLNIDRMTLESRSVAWTANERAAIQKVKNDIGTLNARQKTLRADIKKGDTAIVNARVKKGTVKTAAAKENWQTKIDALTKQRTTDIADLKKTEIDLKKKIAELKKLQKELKALELKNKPVFGKDETLDENGNMKRDHDITAAESKKIVTDYEKSSPEFKEIAKKLYAYLDNLQTMRVEAGLITREQADYMKKLYPHYVPSYRDTEGGGVAIVKGKNNLEISTTVKKAKGGNQDILEVASSVAQQTDELMKAGQINVLAGAIYDAAKDSGDTTQVEIISEEQIGGEEGTDAILRPKPGQLTFHRDGKRITMQVSREILLGFEGLRSPSVDLTNPIMRAMGAINALFKRGVTSLNPAFMLRNPIRDLQDAGINSKHPAGFAKAIVSVSKDIAQNSKEWELYRALGGFSSTVFDGTLGKQSGARGFESIAALFDTDAEGFSKVWEKAKATAKSPLAAVENANAFLEQMTRFAEFKASLAAGDSPSVALNNAAEVTTNFGRRGKTTKVMNATLMPFLNPAIQGFDKIFRNVGDAFTSGQWAKGLASLITKAALIGVVPMVLNAVMYGGDDDYEKLREEDKENNFLIKVGDGSFIKIPRGRLAGVIGGAANRIGKAARGEDADLAGYLKNAKTQITPVENLSRTIFSPIFDVKNNKTWYGGEIEGQEFDSTAPRDRYDESTSRIAVAIGSIIPNGWNFSPKKIHYLLDQYSGVIGDFVLPATSQKEHKDFFSGNFTLDSVTNNKLSEKFYELYDKTQYADTAGDVNASFRLKYLNRVKKSIRELNNELDAARAEDIDNKEKMAKVRVIRALINAEYDAALKSVATVDEAISATESIADETLRDAEITRTVFGAESALRNYNAKSFEKYALFAKAGIGFDEMYAYHFATLGIENDLDKKGNPIEGSKRKKIVAIVNALNIPTEQKVMLLASKGYAVKDGEIRGVTAKSAKTMLQRYIVKSNLSKAEKEALAKACGFTVKNGVIVNK